VVTWHEYWGEHWLEYLPQRPVVARAAWALEATARRLGDQRVAVSELTARRVAGRGPVPVVGNGVDVERIASATPDPVESDVIHLGRLIDEKRVDVLVRAIARVADRSPGVRCLIVGDGPERERLESLVSALGVAASVRFLGAVPDDRIPALLRASRMLALPSQREGYGIVVAEAKAAGIVPIVARGLLTAAPDLVRDEVDGLVFDGSVEALAAAIRRLLQQPRTRERLARAAAGAARDLGWAERAGEMERLYLATARRSRGEASGAAPAAGRQTASRAASPARADAS
jgi:glycosyltransferase involved in cell wall biosynthesis